LNSLRAASTMRVRWALEEAGLPYRVRTVTPEERETAAYRREQPFGQMPVLHDGAVSVFESGAILLYLGERHPAVLPVDPAARTQATMWMFAALNTVEQHVTNLAELLIFHAGEAWARERRPALEAMALRRLGEVDAQLEERDYLAGPFSAADILMTTVLRPLDRIGLVDGFSRLAAYKARCMARPAFARALADYTAQYAPARAA
jgi:glutathione S-transferase